MDETSLSFDLPYSTTLEARGAKTVNIRTTGHERSCFTVILACLADGTKLEPTVIFKLKNIPRETFPEGVHVRVNEKGWCNGTEMLYWINNVWSEHNSFGNPNSLLVLDSFRGHTLDSVIEEFTDKQTHLAVIPGGLTSKLQPLDVAINKGFKEKVSVLSKIVCLILLNILTFNL